MRYQTRYMYIKNHVPAVVVTIGRRRLVRIFSFFLLGCGFFLLLYVVSPILSWQFFYAPTLTSGNMLSPIPKTLVLKQQGIGNVLGSNAAVSFGTNLTYASNWFPTGNPKTNIHKQYTFSIPRLGIKNAKVIVGADDLSKSLIHYGGSSLPGEYGNAVIFGHSVLPQFFNPANYNTIFSTLHTLKEGDVIEVASEGIRYRYRIFSFSVVSPTDISVLEQTYDDSYITVITCTPPGTYWKRLVVKAKIEKI